MTFRMNPYLVLEGNAREAVAFYEKAIGAQVVYVMPFSEMPAHPDYPLPEAAKNLVAHALLKVGDSQLMISDTFPGQSAPGGEKVTVLIETSDLEQSRAIFEALSEGGRVDRPFAETFWSPGFGTLTDKFGVPFQITTEGQQGQP